MSNGNEDIVDLTSILDEIAAERLRQAGRDQAQQTQQQQNKKDSPNLGNLAILHVLLLLVITGLPLLQTICRIGLQKNLQLKKEY